VKKDETEPKQQQSSIKNNSYDVKKVISHMVVSLTS